jgi:hypothetical protein
MKDLEWRSCINMELYTIFLIFTKFRICMLKNFYSTVDIIDLNPPSQNQKPLHS